MKEYVVKMNGEHIKTFKARYKKLYKATKRQAVKLCGKLSKENIGAVVTIEDDGEIIWTARKIYTDRDPVWNTVPNVEDCINLHASITRQAIYDATGGKISRKKGSRDYEVAHEGGIARKYLRSKNFDDDCSVLGILPEDVRDKVEKVNGKRL